MVKHRHHEIDYPDASLCPWCIADELSKQVGEQNDLIAELETENERLRDSMRVAEPINQARWERLQELERWQKEARAVLCEVLIEEFAGATELYLAKGSCREWIDRRDALLANDN